MKTSPSTQKKAKKSKQHKRLKVKTSIKAGNRFILLEDQTNSPSGDTPGADIDAI